MPDHSTCQDVPITLVEAVVAKIAGVLPSAPWGPVIGPTIYALFIDQEQTGLYCHVHPLYDYSRERILKRIGARRHPNWPEVYTAGELWTPGNELEGELPPGVPEEPMDRALRLGEWRGVAQLQERRKLLEQGLDLDEADARTRLPVERQFDEYCGDFYSQDESEAEAAYERQDHVWRAVCRALTQIPSTIWGELGVPVTDDFVAIAGSIDGDAGGDVDLSLRHSLGEQGYREFQQRGLIPETADWK
jgi:hypothetical protein